MFSLVVFLLQICGLTQAWFESCNQAKNISVGGQLSINSPNYPNSQYPAGSSCIYVITGPSNHAVKMSCYINLAVSFLLKFSIASLVQCALTFI